MKKLDQYIHDNKHLFDEEPEAGHFDRLQQKMDRSHRKIMMMRRYAGIAASVVLLFSAGMLYRHVQPSDRVTVICENSEDIKHCYIDKMYDVANEITYLTRNMDHRDRQEVMDDVQSIIDATDTGLENELPEELPRDAARSILSDYYQRNLRSMQMIAETLKERDLGPATDKE